ncbi:MAG: prepilin-type N-terminal cleavage/methylation domain-containing protein [Candidatus Riflebacteria bacterium]|jgi:prepilin-type N-terminal cleavage/methylation domain-containing protein|nr:prepilin-type N-terminal cleavage/methylation domain-containing protein [Candidatus Riflebacteria bacterium]
MKRSGFTLIELMIVIAVLSIAMSYIFPGLQAVILEEKHHTKVLRDAASLTTLYGLMSTELKFCSAVESADEKGVRFDQNRAIIVHDGGRRIQIGKRHIRLDGGARCWGFEKVDDRTFSTQIKNGHENIRVIWRTGAER